MLLKFKGGSGDCTLFVLYAVDFPPFQGRKHRWAEFNFFLMSNLVSVIDFIVYTFFISFKEIHLVINTVSSWYIWQVTSS